MKTHPLKIWPEYFAAVTEQDPARRKNYEIRYNDRDYQQGDILELREYNPNTEEFSGRQTRRLVTHIVKGPPFLPENLAVMSLGEVPDA